MEGKRMEVYLRKAPRVLAGPEGKPFLLAAGVEKMALNLARYYNSTRLVLLRVEDGDFTEKASTKKSNHVYSGADLLPPGGLRKGGKVVVSSIEQEGSAFKEKISRLLLFEVE